MASSSQIRPGGSPYQRYLSSHFRFLHAPTREALDRDYFTWQQYAARFLPRDKSARIVDLGCGFGSFLYFLHKQGYRRAYGVDLSSEQVAAAWSLGVPNAVLGDALEFLDRSTEPWHLVTAFDLLEHLPAENLLLLLHSVLRALTPGGVFLLRVPNADGPFGARLLYSDFTHQRAFTALSIRQVLRSVGFERIDVYPEGPRVHGLLSAVRWLAWKFIQAVLRAYLAVETGQVTGHILTQNLIAAARKPLSIPLEGMGE